MARSTRTRTAVGNGVAPTGGALDAGRGVRRLLAWARDRCGAEAAVAGWGSAGGPDPDPVLAAAPGAGGSGGAEARALLRLAWADPELGHARVLVRTVSLPGRGPLARPGTVVAVVPLLAPPGAPPGARPGAPPGARPGPEGLLCVVGPAGGSFTPAQLDRLVEVGRRLEAHSRARRSVTPREGADGAS